MDYAHDRVPICERKSLFSVSMVLAGVPLCAAGLFTGAALSETLPLTDAITAAFLGAILVTLYAIGIGIIGAKRGLTTTLLVQESFGRLGSSMVTLTLALCLGGWYAVQTGYFGQAINSLFPNGGWLSTPKVAAAWGGLLMMTTAYIGFKGLAFLSMLAVPLIVTLSVWGVVTVIGSHDIYGFVPARQGSLGAAITMVVGSFAVGATVNADITRFCKTIRHALIATISGFLVANIFILVSGTITTMATQGSDLIVAMTAIGLGIPAVLIIILGQWTTNDNNLYLASINATAALPKLDKSQMVLIVGILSTACAVAGITDYFIPFLIHIGILIPPIGGIILAHHFIDPTSHSNRQNGWLAAELPALVAWLAGSACGVCLPIGIPALNSTLIAFLIYALLRRLLSIFYQNVGIPG